RGGGGDVEPAGDLVAVDADAHGDRRQVGRDGDRLAAEHGDEGVGHRGEPAEVEVGLERGVVGDGLFAKVCDGVVAAEAVAGFERLERAGDRLRVGAGGDHDVVVLDGDVAAEVGEGVGEPGGGAHLLHHGRV